MKVKIDREYIDGAIKGNSRHCMIADAIAAQVPYAKNVIVDVQSIRWTDPETEMRYTYLTPPEAQKQLVRFDAGKKVEPFVIDIGQPTLIRSTHAEGDGRPRRTKAQREKARAKASRHQHVAAQENVKRRYATARRQYGLRAFEENQEQE